jgi:hypothetical protein
MLMALFLGKYLLNVLVSDVPDWTASFFFLDKFCCIFRLGCGVLGSFGSRSVTL